MLSVSIPHVAQHLRNPQTLAIKAQRMKQLNRPTLFILSIILYACGLDTPKDTTPSSQTAESHSALELPNNTIIPTEITHTGNAIGNIDGTSGIDPDGSATYNITLWIPAGRAGMQPSLSLAYNSSGENGLLGMGWRLSGTSRITRCGKSVAQDNEASPVTFSATDAFCLDGQRLVAIHGQYGAAGTEYRTENESFARIISVDTDEFGPERFEVFLRDGRVLSYGLENGSSFTGRRVLIRPIDETGIETTLEANHSRYAWALAKTADRAGNFITYHYTSASSAGGNEHLLSRIDYTSSTTSPAPSPTRAIHFRYETRPDTRAQYTSGFKILSSQRLKSIEMHGPNPTATGILRSYRFGFAQSALRGASELRTITECDGGNICKRPLTFSYAPDQYSLLESNTGAADLTDLPNSEGTRDNWTLQPADMNGDGRDDIVYRKSANAQDPATGAAIFKWVVRHTQPQGLGVYQPQDLALPTSCLSPVIGENGRWLDVNGDGLTDVSLVQKIGCSPQSSRQLKYYKNSPTGLQVVDEGEADDLWFADLDGNGTMEALQLRETSEGLQLSYRPNSNGTFQPFLPVNTSYIHNNLAFALDLQASGKMSLLTVDKETTPGQGLDPMRKRFWAVEKIQGQFQKYPTTLVHPGITDKRYLFADINGDKLPDAIRTLPTGGTEIEILTNTGTGFSEPVVHTLPATAAIPPWTRNNGVRIIDFDRDGRDDILLLGSHPQRPGPVVLLSREQSFEMKSLGIPNGRSTLAGYELSQPLDLDGDGRVDIAQVVDGTLRLYKQQGTLPGLLLHVETSLGAKTSFSYKPLTDLLIYRPGTSCSYPLQCVRRGKWVVAEHQVDAGDPHAPRATRFFYEDGRLDAAGRGWLGFSAVVATNVQTEAISRTEYDNKTAVGTAYPYAMRPTRVLSTTLDGETVTRMERKVTYQASSRPAVSGAIQIITTAPVSIQTNEFNNPSSQDPLPGFARTINTTLQYDLIYGNVISKTEATLGGDSSTTTFEYSNTPATWRIGLPTKVQESSTVNGVTAIRTKRMEYDSTTGLLLKEIIDPDDSANRLSISYSRDADGLISQITREATGLPVRTTTFTHNALDRTYPASIVNAVGHTIQYAFHPGLGVMGATSDANSVRTEWQYDGWGRLRRENSPTLADTVVNYIPSSVAGQSFQIHTRRDGGQESWTGYDRLGRAVSERGLAFEPQNFSIVEREYDGLGRLSRVKTPNPRGGANLITTTFKYDRLGRTINVQAPDGTSTSTYFVATPEGLWVRTIGPKGNLSRTLVDVNGRTVRSEDEKTPGVFLTTTYEYGPFGVLLKTRDSAGNETTFEYDRWGRPTRQLTPDSGEALTKFNPFGDIIETKDGAGTVTQFQHDPHGRVTQAESTRDGRTTFVWDQGEHAKGQLTTSTRHGEPSTTLDDITLGYTFDNQARLDTEFWNIETRTYSVSRTYDSHGRPAQLAYPTVNGQTLRIEYSYSPWNGQLDAIKEPGPNGLTHWQLAAVDKTGRLSEESFGNGVLSHRRYDAMGRLKFIDTKNQSTGERVQALAYDYESGGNLTKRYDLVARTSESFSYDTLDRLTQWSVTQNCTTSIQGYGYDDLGNLTSRTVVQGAGVSGTYGYGAGTAGPHAITNSNAGSYSYDGSGNQVSAPSRTAQFTGFRLPSLITDGVNTVTFRYDPLQRRTVKRNSDGSVTTYVGGYYEERRSADGLRTHAFFLSTGGRTVVQALWKEGVGNSVQEKQWLYAHSDRLGSIESLTDSAGNLVLRSKFDPFGQRRYPSNLGTPFTYSSGDVRAGFTGHEHDDELRLVNMQGRMYDPEVGRFLSPDPFVQAPLFGQSFNRYSYAFNNPLRFTDPSGFVASERVTYYDSWYGGYVSRDFAAGTPAASFAPDIGWQTMEGFFEMLHGRSLNPLAERASTSNSAGATGNNTSGFSPYADGGKSILQTIVRGTSSLDTGNNISGLLLLYYYHWTQVYGGLLLGVGYGVIPFTNFIPLPAGMSDDARFGYSVGLLVGSGLELATSVSYILRGLGGSGGAAFMGAFTDAGVLVMPIAADGAASLVTGGVLFGDAIAKADRAINILIADIVTFMVGGSGGPVTMGNGAPWKARKVGDAACNNGCEELAEKIQKSVGGEIKNITQPNGNGMLGGMRDPGGSAFINPAGGQGYPWTYHRVVVKDGRVYDGFTGPAGELISVYKARWQYADWIIFGF